MKKYIYIYGNNNIGNRSVNNIRNDNSINSKKVDIFVQV